MKKQFLICVILCIVLCFMGCSKKEAEDGWVKLTLWGEEYKIDNCKLSIRVDPMIGEGDKMKKIDKGQNVTFELYLGLTDSALLKATKNIEEIENTINFGTYWYFETTNDPVDILKRGISSDDTNEIYSKVIAMTVHVPGLFVISEKEKGHVLWMIIDQINEDRAKGRLKGIVELHKTKVDDAVDEISYDEQYEIEGTFDVPFKKLYRYR